MKRWLVAGLLIGMLAGTVEAGVDSGSTEVSAAFLFMKPEDGDYSQILMGGIGFFIPTWLEVKGTVLWFGDEGALRGAAGGGVDIHVAPSQDIVPYLGAGLLASFGDIDLADDTLVDLHVGLKTFVSDAMSVNYTLSQWKSTGDSDLTYFVGMIGLSFYL